jgi:hypothetical protein
LPEKDYFNVLGLHPGAGEKQIKSAYRKLALKYHPDRNKDAGAPRKFQEITEAYDFLIDHPGYGEDDASTYDEMIAREILKRDRERRQKRARAQREKKRQQDQYFDTPEWHDPILLLRYMGNGLALLLSLSAIFLPILIAFIGDPASLAGTSVFILMGAFALVYIYQKRKTWFRLGKFNTSWKELTNLFRLIPGKPTGERCCYCKSSMADGKPYRIEVLKTVDIRIHSYGGLDHDAGYKNKIKKVVIPRSARAHYYHRMASLVKVLACLGFLILFPVESMIWRFIAGMVAGGILSAVLLKLAGVRSKVSYLLTPGLIIKSFVWVMALILISSTGPGFDIQVSSYVYLVVFGLFFFLDMFFDLVVGFFPFYQKMFRPLIPQGTILDSIYHEGYQNYQELPVYSVIFPLIRWFF